ncbi:energy-coupling factor transporter transmembrane protein EcfT [Clostridium sp. 'deep sea']|uniref:energy-coupling factor transporter transmembrane component T family protein n=1 Tax=Clostridium sp. 'deep sea' TaxID=2779445 RepID=UPI00189690E4|nr:energy-coupling factor transporter transmembrane component T [Clostridium sp. 'deep sea']QOR35408.1 energy-coupling factor transporter transmembrane protein EcfT [Clostridium sp. 'deep sea']
MTQIDPRTKLFVIVCLSTLAITFENLAVLVTILCLEILFALMLKAQVLPIFKKLRKILFLIIGIILLQSIFITNGNVIFALGKFKLLTDIGLIKGLGYLLRVLIIFLSGIIISTSSMRDLIQGLIQIKLPYDIAFMVSIGIKFVPLLMEQFQDTLRAIELRGIDIKRLKLKQKIEVYSYIFTPVIVSTLNKARYLAISIETRGFRAYPRRTSLYSLKLKSLDYFVMFISVIITISIIYINLKVI